jgi:hypothetical protein
MRTSLRLCEASALGVQPNRCPRRCRLGQLPRDDMLVSKRAALLRNEKKNRSCQILVIPERNSAPPIQLSEDGMT